MFGVNKVMNREILQENGNVENFWAVLKVFVFSPCLSDKLQSSFYSLFFFSTCSWELSRGKVDQTNRWRWHFRLYPSIIRLSPRNAFDKYCPLIKANRYQLPLQRPFGLSFRAGPEQGEYQFFIKKICLLVFYLKTK